MRALVVACHPVPESFNAALRDVVLARLTEAGAEIRLTDLYAIGFDPVMSTEERREYHTPGRNEEPIRRHLDDLLWCDTLVFVYPTWWYGLPAMLKGWLDRVFVPHATFEMPEPGRPIRSKLTHIEKLAVVTTGGSPWWFAELVIGNPGRRTLVRGMRALCAPGCKTLFVCHYQMDSSTPESRAKFLRQVGTKIAKFAR